jgi:hypothetical protein
LSSDNNIYPTIKWFAAKGFERFSAHDHWHGPSSLLKKLKVFWKMPQQLIVLSNGIVITGRHN